MRGRYALYAPKSHSHAERLYFDSLEEFPGTYNAAPSHIMPIARLKDRRPDLIQAKWGFVPYWAKDENSAYKCINARCETVASSPAFRDAYRYKRRCLVPASGFYEWKKGPHGKQPYFIVMGDSGLMSFAGVWEKWKRPDGELLTTYTIITTARIISMSERHGRCRARRQRAYSLRMPMDKKSRAEALPS